MADTPDDACLGGVLHNPWESQEADQGEQWPSIDYLDPLMFQDALAWWVREHPEDEMPLRDNWRLQYFVEEYAKFWGHTPL